MNEPELTPGSPLTVCALTDHISSPLASQHDEVIFTGAGP